MPGGAPQDGSRRTGQGCAPGRVTGLVRVVTGDPAEVTLRPGEILVAPSTDPGWITLMTQASAIIVERGSLLSHSAIVARELAIPTVVAVADATRWLRTGDLVHLDGASGLIQRLDSASASAAA